MNKRTLAYLGNESEVDIVDGTYPYKNGGTSQRNYSVANISSINMYAKLIITLCAVGVARSSGILGAAPLAYSSHAIAAPAVITKTITPAVSSISSYSSSTSHGSPVATYAAGPVIAKSYAAPAYASYAAPAYSAYAAPAYSAYAAPAVVTKTITPAVSSVSAYSTQTAHGAAYSAPIVAKAYAAPAAYSTYAAAPAVATYSAAPAVVTKTITPAVSSISSYSTSTSHGSPVATYAAGPVIAKSYAAPAYTSYAAPAYAAYAAPAYSAYAAPAVVTKTITPAVSSVSSYSTQTAHGAAYSTPIVAKAYATPAAYSTYAAAVPAAYSTYAAAAPAAYTTYSAGAPILKSAVAYSAAPAVAYSGHAANYGW